MVRSMFAGVAGLKAHQQKMDVIGNNIANVNTWGYKAYSFNFTDSIYTTSVKSSGGTGETNTYGGKNPSQVGYGSVMGSISFQYTTGAPSPTDNDLDCMIDGTGLFLVGTKKDAVPQTDAGIRGSGCYLSRVGIFTIDNNGYLVDNAGNYVFGFAAQVYNNNAQPAAPFQGTGAPSENDNGRLMYFQKDENGTITGWSFDPTFGEVEIQNDGDMTPLQIPVDTMGTVNGTPTPIRHVLNNYSIDEQGVIMGANDRGEPITLGQLALIAVENPNGMEKDTGYYFNIGDNCGGVSAHTPGGNIGRIRSKYLEMPNVDLANEFSNMITTQRGFQANSKIITVTDEMLQELVNMKR